MNTLLRTLLLDWRDQKLPTTLKRDIQLDLTPQKGVRNATVITGFRRVGKTYLVYEAIERLLQTHKREDILYLNFEDERITNPSIDLLTDLLPEAQAVFGRKPKYLFLDELQLIPDWSKWVRRMLDTEEMEIFITGSSSKMSSYELPTEMRGRSWEVKVFPLSMEEFLRFKHETIDIQNLAYRPGEQARFAYLFTQYLTFGGLPAVVLTEEAKKQELLQSYFQTVVQKEIGEREKIENAVAMRTLLKLLLNSSYITISKLHNNLKSMNIPVGKTTVDNYMTYIENSYFMKELYIFNPSMINQLQYPRKVYFVDTGFMTALSTKFSTNMGRLFENAVYNKLSRQHETMYYYKDENENEVDFAILEEGKTSALYQVCYDLTDEETRNREVKSLLKAGKTLNCSTLRLVTLSKNETMQLPTEIEVITPEKIL